VRGQHGKENSVSILLDNGKIRLEIEPEHGRFVSLRHTGLDMELIGTCGARLLDLAWAA
jgi:hypothetical protein